MIATREAVRLVAARELVTRVRSKAFRIILAVTAVAFVAVPLVIQLVNQGPDTQHVAVSDPGFGRTLSATARQLRQPLQVRTVGGREAGARQVRDGSADAYAVPGPRGIAVTVHKSLPGSLRTLFSVVQQRSTLASQVEKLGGDPARVAAAVAGVRLQVHAQQRTDPKQGQKIGVAIGAGVLIYMILMTVGQMVAQGVVEEKGSRVVELLLSTVRPWQLMAGKILGIGALGLLQLLVPGVLALAVGIGIGTLDLSLADSVGTLLWSLAWFAAGFALYAMAFAAVGAMVSRQEDLGGLMLPIVMPLVAAWVVGISVLPSNPGNTTAAVLSFLPPTAPVLMPMRWAMGVAPWWQLVVALALTVVVSAGMLRLTGRIYRNSVLRSGARVPFRDALKSA
ncbi:MAG: ABC transporter permease [Marmoricola sp.]